MCRTSKGSIRYLTGRNKAELRKLCAFQDQVVAAETPDKARSADSLQS